MPQRQLCPVQLPSLSVFLLTKTRHTEFHCPLQNSSLVVSSASFEVEPRDFTPDTCQPAYPLRPVNPSNARSLRITAAAGTELATASSLS